MGIMIIFLYNPATNPATNLILGGLLINKLIAIFPHYSSI